MQDNVRTMIENQSDLTDLEGKSDNIRETAFTMKSMAKKLESEARKRNCKLIVIMVCLVIAILIAIIVPIATKAAAVAP